MRGRFRQDSSSLDDQKWADLSSHLRTHTFSSTPELNPRFKQYLTQYIPETIDQQIDPLKDYPLLKSAKDYLENDGWTYELLESHSTIAFGFEGRNGKWHCMVQTREKENQLIFYSSLENGIPEEYIEKLMRFITIVNYRLVVGNFEMDISDGELNYKTALDLDEITPSQSLIRNMIQTNLATFDRHLLGINSIIEGKSVDFALDIVEIESS